MQEKHDELEKLLRIRPLGSDRNHRRYWLFDSAAPGVYLEAGWFNHENLLNALPNNALMASALTFPSDSGSLSLSESDRDEPADRTKDGERPLEKISGHERTYAILFTCYLFTILVHAVHM